MQGKTVDIEKLRQQNEEIVAVGNMNVNARGDQIGPGGSVIKTREQIMKDYYEKPKGVVSDTPAVPERQITPMPKQEEVVVETKILDQTPAPAPKQEKKITTFKPKTAQEKTGIDGALDGIE